MRRRVRRRDRDVSRSYPRAVICPKCQGYLRTVERQGVRIDQCERCRGIFLDHGELEHLLSAEQHYYGGYASTYRDSPRPFRGRPDSPRPYRAHPDSPRPYRDHHGRHGHPDSPRPYGHQGHHADSPRPYRHGHKRSFLDDLFG